MRLFYHSLNKRGEVEGRRLSIRIEWCEWPLLSLSFHKYTMIIRFLFNYSHLLKRTTKADTHTHNKLFKSYMLNLGNFIHFHQNQTSGWQMGGHYRALLQVLHYVLFVCVEWPTFVLCSVCFFSFHFISFLF